jgi:hypothetical protein
MYITSIQEGNHGVGSFHYLDPADAFDFRRLNVPMDELRAAAGPDFDVVVSANGAIHCEYDPK